MQFKVPLAVAVFLAVSVAPACASGFDDKTFDQGMRMIDQQHAAQQGKLLNAAIHFETSTRNRQNSISRGAS